MTNIIDTPTEVLALFVKQAERDGYRAAAESRSLTDCAAHDNTFRAWANELRRERGAAVYRACVNAYVEGKRAGAAAWEAWAAAHA